ncbi:hypothetical protein J6590_020488 [Homalodisca vitripennis]|nr:hypothetical protein J6590_020488 [Homalodisca vitripennis]
MVSSCLIPIFVACTPRSAGTALSETYATNTQRAASVAKRVFTASLVNIEPLFPALHSSLYRTDAAPPPS